MKRYASLLLAALTTVTLVSGCSEPNTPESGTVVERRHATASVRPMMTEQWSLLIVNGSSSGIIYVSENVYDRCPPGTRYPRCIQQPVRVS